MGISLENVWKIRFHQKDMLTCQQICELRETANELVKITTNLEENDWCDQVLLFRVSRLVERVISHVISLSDPFATANKLSQQEVRLPLCETTATPSPTTTVIGGAYLRNKWSFYGGFDSRASLRSGNQSWCSRSLKSPKFVALDERKRRKSVPSLSTAPFDLDALKTRPESRKRDLPTVATTAVGPCPANQPQERF